MCGTSSNQSHTPKRVVSWTNSEHQRTKSKRSDCRCPAAFRSAKGRTVVPRLPITIQMGQRVQWWDDLSETLTVVGCAMWQTVQKLIDNDEAKMRLQEHYPRCHDDVFYLLRRRNVDELIWLPQRSLKLIREDVERPTVAWNDERHSYELTRQYRIEIPTPDGEPIQLGAKVATKRIGVTLVASLVGMLWRRSELAAYFAEEYGEMWDMNGPDWRNSDLCLLMPSGSLATEMAQNGDSETPFNHGVDGPTAIVHPAIDLEVF